MSPPELSIIIPTKNEESCIQRTLHCCGRSSRTEIVVVDGGSADQTVQIAQGLGICVLESEPGRARQMNLGVQSTSGDRLLFLHADTLLPEDFLPDLLHTLEQPGTVAGAFRLRIESEKRSLRLIEKTANLRSRWLQMPYGDQGLFLSRETFDSVGGFQPLPIMEDLDLVRRLKKLGRIRMAPKAVLTSGRRWDQKGPWMTTVANQAAIAAYFLGLPLDAIARWYGQPIHAVQKKGQQRKKT